MQGEDIATQTAVEMLHTRERKRERGIENWTKTPNQQCQNTK
jgi:hypothetical protein